MMTSRTKKSKEVCKAALEFMISLSDPGGRTDAWSTIVRGYLCGMDELQDDELASWLDGDVCGMP